MTRRERVINSLNHKESDIVPYTALFTIEEHKKIAEYTKDPHFEDKWNLHIHFGEYWGDAKPMAEKPGFYKDDFGMIWNRTVDKDIGVVDTHVIDNIDTHDYTFPKLDEKKIKDACESLVAAKEDKFTLYGIGFSMFERSWSMYGMENILVAMIDSPKELEKLLDNICEFDLSIIDIACEYDIDGIYFGDDWGQQKGLIMGPLFWRKFIKPRMKRLYDKVKSKGKYVIQHSCGDINEIYKDLIDIGLDCHQTFQPEIYDIEKVKKEYGGSMSFWGGISTQQLLPNATAKKVKEETKRIMDIMKKGGGFIASPTHAVPPDVPPENILAMMEVFLNQ